ncbi:MAG: PH domain-containing protein [Acidimicrobiales bacterium]
MLDLLSSARQWAIPLAFLMISTGEVLVLGPIAFVVIALVVGWKVLAWRRFTYQVADGVLVIEHGILQRARREVPISRIQQVDLRRRLRHRALGVAVVRIDTAGGGSGAEAVLEAIADEEAYALRVALLDRRGVPPAGAGPVDAGAATDAVEPADPRPAPAAGPAPVPVVALTTGQLVVAGITGVRLLALLPFAAAGMGLFFELPEETAAGVAGSAPTGAVVVAVLLVAVIPVMLLSAIASSLLTDHGFTLVRVGTDLHLRRGLLDQREATLSLRRVQAVRVHQNLLRRRLGLASVQLQSAGSGTAAEGEVTRLTIPYVREGDLVGLLDSVLPTTVEHPPLVPAPPAARRRAWFRRVGPATVLLVAIAVAATLAGAPIAWALLVLLVPVAVEAELVYRNLGHVGTPTLVVARSGGFVRATDYLPVAKTQSTSLSSSPFQRRVGLASLQLHVAGRGSVPVVHDGDADRLARLRLAALHARVARADEVEVRRRARVEAAAAAEGDEVPSAG